MSLEIPTPKTPGDEIRRTEAPTPVFAGYLILGFTGLTFLFATLVMTAVYDGFATARLDAATMAPEVAEAPLAFMFQNEQVIVAFWIAMLLFCTFFITLLYQRFYLDHITIAKRRFRKWEDEGVQLRG